MNHVKNALAIVVWLVAICIRLVLFLVGLVIVPFTNAKQNPIWGNREDPVPPPWFMSGKSDGLRDYVWRALRNPTNNLRFLLEEPHEDKWMTWGSLDPESTVRNFAARESTRFSRSGPFFEYWRIWRTKDEDAPIAEIRIGWKRSPVPGFGLTFQWRKGK